MYTTALAAWSTRYRLLLPPRRQQLWVERSNPARVYLHRVVAFRKRKRKICFIEVNTIFSASYPRKNAPIKSCFSRHNLAALFVRLDDSEDQFQRRCLFSHSPETAISSLRCFLCSAIVVDPA
jgi:hypothetical protein